MRVEDPKARSQPRGQLSMVCCINGEVLLGRDRDQWYTDGDTFHWSNSTDFCCLDGLLTTGYICTKWMLFPLAFCPSSFIQTNISIWERVGSPL